MDYDLTSLSALSGKGFVYEMAWIGVSCRPRFGKVASACTRQSTGNRIADTKKVRRLPILEIWLGTSHRSAACTTNN